ncbi:hypothetical protein V3481_015367 [Fusarium oxysporum f. sp. vasinfectum]|uniref:Uncharacterized protein n=1 Tax=Fusarium oxysporum f. sp. vasinfectum 25433 TaxID=1089449 RepID=X0KWK2_FUSOX|nr:hypothetical protein FOTG_13856 [Fusarium oxysporum f. sp. vasinfectum 25433]
MRVKADTLLYFILRAGLIHHAPCHYRRNSADKRVGQGSENQPSLISETVKQDIISLAEMAPCHHIVKQAYHLLRYLANQWNIDIDIDTGAALNLEEHKWLTRPFGSNLDLLAPMMTAKDFMFNLGITLPARNNTRCRFPFEELVVREARRHCLPVSRVASLV